MKTFTAKPSNIKREWLLIDATDKTLGRLATEVAMILRGKNKPEYTPHMDTGDYVVIVNAEKVAVTGNKRKAKNLLPSYWLYWRYQISIFREANSDSSRKSY